VLRARGGRLGFNLTILIETGEESGSLGLRELCAPCRELRADLLIASDGPRVAAALPAVFPGSRGVAQLETLTIRNLAERRSGRWFRRRRRGTKRIAELSFSRV
jgi:acetylornithine deacetylase/succinyl-diaminopimelate desuccinylase-like protein